MAKFEDPRPSRSDKYQYLICEIVVSVDKLALMSNNRSYNAVLNPFRYDEKVLELQDKLKEKFWKIAYANLTERQAAVMKLLSDGYTQMEIADILDVNQSSICKCISGNTDYKEGNGSVKQYGGIHKKLKKIMLNDPELNDLLNQINELREENY